MLAPLFRWMFSTNSASVAFAAFNWFLLASQHGFIFMTSSVVDPVVYTSD